MRRSTPGTFGPTCVTRSQVLRVYGIERELERARRGWMVDGYRARVLNVPPIVRRLLYAEHDEPWLERQSAGRLVLECEPSPIDGAVQQCADLLPGRDLRQPRQTISHLSLRHLPRY